LLRRFAVSVSLAAMLALSACGQEKSPDSRASQVNPDNVDGEALRRLATDERVRRFYEARQWAPAWTGERADQLAAAIREAERHGIDSKKLIKDAAAEADPTEREAALTMAAIVYADALADGIAEPKKMFEVYEIKGPEVDVVGGLQRAVEANEVGPWLAGLAPSDPEYKALSEAYLSYKAQAAKGGGQRIEPGESSIKPGQRDARVPAIANALRTNGYLAAPQPQQGDGTQAEKAKQPAAPADGQVYTKEMAAAVARLQKDYGIDADGVIGNSTLEALNAGAADRARILAVNLERRRWLERQTAPTRIDVNTAAAHLDYWRDGSQADRRRVVVGQPDWETPEIGSPLFQLVANPDWTVPDSIAEEEILPKGAGYMASQNMKMVNGRIVQQPGPKSALGLVKFDLSNKHAIYLHDTPAKALFATNDRHSSHGCARVHDAIGFARMIADHAGVREKFDKALASGDKTAVPLGEKIPVRFLYHTAYVEGGKVVFRTDPYGWDETLAQALGFEKRLRQTVKTHYNDTGP
jgi:murein L,D-transpeptidase YcbB/YkuD